MSLGAKNIIATVLLGLVSSAMFGQAMDNTLSFQGINNDSYFRFNFEDDYFTGTDYYYTGGMSAELVMPWVKDFPLSKFLLHPKRSYIRYGLGLESDLYTPTDIGKSYILYGDRPYAACLFLKTFAIAIDTTKKQRYSTAISTGIIGPGAGAMDVQTTVHRALPHNTIPGGWGNQVQNDAVLNYQFDYEKQLQSLGHVFSLDADGIARAGTLSDKAGVGITAMGGYFDSPFSSEIITKSNFRFYIYEHPEIDVIGYDATMEGGIFDRTSPYIIAAGDISRFTFLNRYGFVCTTNKWYFEYAHTFLSNEFKTGLTHSWGSVQIAFGF
jgi:hypothetical protein